MLKTRLVPLAAATFAALFPYVCLPLAAAPAVPPEDAARILPVSQVRAGMQGYGLTVFRGARVERFDVKVLGVMPGMNLGRPLILVRIGGGELDRRPINIAEGMSGSPVYIQGRIIGAISFAGSFAREPIGLVTPIEDMLSAWDSSLPASPPGLDEPRPLPSSIPVGQGRIRAYGITTDPARAASGGPDGTAWFRPLTGTVTVSGFSARALSLLSAGLSGIPLQVREGPGRMERGPLPLKEGSAVGFSLVTGDVDVTAVGTVTYRRGDRVLAFGHPFLQIGPLEAPMCTAWVHDVFTSYLSSFKLASPVSFVGASTHDLPFAVSARVGHRPAMVPVEVTMRVGQRGAVRRFRASVVRHPLVTPLLTRAVAMEAVSRLRPYPGEGMALVRTTVKPAGMEPVERTNLFFSDSDVASAALEDLNALVTLLQGNRFGPVLPERVSLDVTLYETRQTAEIERAYTDRTTYRPGESVRVHVQIRPYRAEPVTQTLEVTIPENAPDGRAVLVVQGGGSGLGRSASGPSGAQTAPPSRALEDIRNAVSLRQMLQRFRELDANNSLVARVILPSASFSLNGERLIGLSPVMEEALQSAGGSGLRLLRDEVRSTLPTGWVVQGSQMVSITIQRRSLLEKASAPASAPSLPAARPAPSPSGGSSGESGDEASDSGSEAVETAVWRQASESGGEPAAASPSAEESAEESTGEPQEAAAPQEGEEKASQDGVARPSGKAPAKDTTPGPSVSDVGRKTRTWLQHSREDFLKGEGEGVAVSSRGGLTAGYAFRRLTSFADAFVWSVAWLADGSIVAASGTKGEIRRIGPDGSASVLASLGPVVPSCLAVDGEAVWAGTSPDGGVWLIEGGTHRAVTRLPGVHPAAMVAAEDGSVIVAGGGSGRIWRVGRDGSAGVVADTGQAHVTALALAEGGALYAATSGGAAVWRIGEGEPRAVFRAAEDFVCSLAPGRDGSVCAATGPRGKIYRLRPGQAPVILVEKLSASFASLTAGEDGSVLACEGASLHLILPDDTVLTSRSREPFEAYSAAFGKDGRLAIGSASGGGVWLAERAAGGWFESAIHDAERPADWGAVRLAGTGEAASLTLKVRTGNTDRPGEGWSAWRDVTEARVVGASGARYLQYRIELAGAQAPAGVREVEFSYLPANRPPTVKLTSPEPGAFWSGEKEIRWSGSDPDRDRLTYQVLLSSDGGKTWKPLGQAAQASGASGQDGGGGAAKLSDEEIERRMKEELDRNPDLPESVRKQMWSSRAAFVAKVREREEARSSGQDGSAKDSAAEQPSRTKETSRKWDTRGVADGEYLLKIVASDELSNGSRALTAEAVSGPVRVCNTKPEAIVFAASAEFEDGRLRRLEGRADGKGAPVAAVEYRLDGKGEWATAEPADGVFDQDREYFVINVSEAVPGKRSVEVRVKDAAGNTASVTRDLAPRQDGAPARG